MCSVAAVRVARSSPIWLVSSSGGLGGDGRPLDPLDARAALGLGGRDLGVLVDRAGQRATAGDQRGQLGARRGQVGAQLLGLGGELAGACAGRRELAFARQPGLARPRAPRRPGWRPRRACGESTRSSCSPSRSTMSATWVAAACSASSRVLVARPARRTRGTTVAARRCSARRWSAVRASSADSARSCRRLRGRDRRAGADRSSRAPVGQRTLAPRSSASSAGPRARWVSAAASEVVACTRVAHGTSEPSSACGREVAHVPLAGDRRATGLDEAVQHGGDVVVAGPALPPQGQPPLREPPLDVLEALGAEQPLQDGLALRRAGAQEGLEPVLREHRHLGELHAGHAEEPGDQLAGLVEPRRVRESRRRRGAPPRRRAPAPAWCRCRASWAAPTRATGGSGRCARRC